MQYHLHFGGRHRDCACYLQISKTRSSLQRMRGPEGWLYGFQNKFDRQWKPVSAGPLDARQISVGAQLTGALALIRLADQTQEVRYREAGMEIGRQITDRGYDAERGIWLEVVPSLDSARSESIEVADAADIQVHWWHQIYGAFLQLHLYRLTGEPEFLQNFDRTEEFFDEHFHDRVHGGIFGTVDQAGQPLGHTYKSRAWKTPYHEMEHALLNYLYVSLFVVDRPVTLHFRLQGEGLFPVSPVDGSLARIASVQRNGQAWQEFDAEQCLVSLPAGSHSLTVKLERAAAN
jgi:hypothetical protein